MGFGYRKTFKAGPFRATVSKSGVSYSAGVKGARVTRRANGKVQARVTVPKTGVSYTTRQAPKPRQAARPAAPAVKAAPPRAPAPRPAAHAKPARPPKPLPGPRSSIVPRPPWGLRAPRTFTGRFGTVRVSEWGVQLEPDAAGRIGNRAAAIPWGDVIAVDFLEPRWGRLGHVHFVTTGDPRGLTVLGRGTVPGTAAGGNPRAMRFSSGQRAVYDELRLLVGG